MYADKLLFLRENNTKIMTPRTRGVFPEICFISERGLLHTELETRIQSISQQFNILRWFY
jgi:hypothetical protein